MVEPESLLSVCVVGPVHPAAEAASLLQLLIDLHHQTPWQIVNSAASLYGQSCAALHSAEMGEGKLPPTPNKCCTL